MNTKELRNTADCIEKTGTQFDIGHDRILFEDATVSLRWAADRIDQLNKIIRALKNNSKGNAR